MKWKNKGKELDVFAKKWTEKSEYYIWGAALVGKSFYKKFKDILKIKGFIDSDINKQGNKIENLQIFSPQILQREKCKVIVASYFYPEISNELEKCDYKEDTDFCDSRIFTEVYFMYHFNKLYLHRTDISITTKCTLKCTKCNMWTNYYKSPNHKSFETLKSDFDLYFKWVDYVDRMYILGGEAFLHPQLEQILSYLGGQYNEKIERLELFTNGMIIPNHNILDCCKKYKFAIFISDYTNTNPNLKESLKKFKGKLDAYNIEYLVDEYDRWLDFGNPTVMKEMTETDKMKHFKECHMIWRGLHDEKYYFCHSDCSAKRAGIIEDNPNDYFELKEFNENRKIELMEFDLGFTERGYLSLCERCNGSYGVNDQYTEVAIQQKTR